MTETDSGWLLRHRDGVEHGPFRLADIIAAAGTGNIADDTTVFHQTHTQGNWVLASRIQPIAAEMGVRMEKPAARKQPTTRPQATTQPAPSRQEPAPNATTPGMAPTSAFRRRTAQPLPNAPGNAPQQPPAAIGHASYDDNDAAKMPSDTGRPHTVRTRHRSFPVPKHSHEAALAFFDFRFRYFVTPWIIKILWSITVMVTLLWLAVMTYNVWVQPSMNAPGPRTVEGASDWEFTPLANQPFFQSDFFAYALVCGITLLLVLLARVALEFMIVFFRIATDIAELKQSYLKD